MLSYIKTHTPEEVVADLPGPITTATSPTGSARYKAEVMRVSALTASLTNTLDEIIADGVGAALGLCSIENLLVIKCAGTE